MKRIRRFLFALLVGTICGVTVWAQAGLGDIINDLAMWITGYTYFHVGHGADGFTHSVSTRVQICTQRVVIVSDCTQQSDRALQVKSVSGVHVAADGREIPWLCQTKDRRTFSRVSVNGVDRRFADGNTFLITTKDGEIRVKQMQIDDNRTTSLRKLLQDSPNTGAISDVEQKRGVP